MSYKFRLDSDIIIDIIRKAQNGDFAYCTTIFFII